MSDMSEKIEVGSKGRKASTRMSEHIWELWEVSKAFSFFPPCYKCGFSEQRISERPILDAFGVHFSETKWRCPRCNLRISIQIYASYDVYSRMRIEQAIDRYFQKEREKV
jgi:hypothetical protein